MTTRLQQLSERRRLLVARCAEQRTALAADIAKVGRHLWIGNLAQGAVRAWPALAVAALVVVGLRRPLRLLRWASTALSFYALARRMWRMYQTLAR